MAPTLGYPTLPTITEADLILETFSHKSLKLEYDAEMTTDNERLIELGNTTMQFAVTRYLYAKRPIVRASDIPAQRDGILTAEKYEEWVNHYNLRQRLRYLPSDDIDITTPEETINLFHAYVGAVCWQHGPANATNWILPLINPDAAIIPNTGYEQNESSDNRATKRQRSEPSSPKFSPPPVPMGPPPPAPASSPYSPIPVYNGGSQASLSGTATPTGHQATPPTLRSPGFLPMFNQKCAQLHLKVEYQAANHGQPHAPRWMIQCLVNGIMKGHGEGASKQVAKEAAANVAYHAMGWAAY